MNDDDRSVDRDPLDALAEEFIARYRRGDRPSVLEYVNKYPELADQLRELLPTLVMMEDVRPDAREFQHAPIEDSTAGRLKLERIGDYRILREVGRGGMGIVYEAEQESLGRHVALKVLPRHALLDPRQLERFRREARAAARLHHTNIVPVFGTGEHDGLHYHVMQFIQGLGLDAVLVEVARLRNIKAFTNRSSVNGMECRQAATGDRDKLRDSAREVAEALITGRFRCEQGAIGHAEPGDKQPPVRCDDVLCSDSDRPLADAAAVPAPARTTADRSDASHSNSSSSRLRLPGQDADTAESGVQYWRSVARIGVQVADALAYANGQGVLHRDIKPSNLLLDTDGTVWVTDFGLAKASESDDLTHTGDIVGTLRYLAPERLQGCADARSDIYGLGITLYELLTLRHPFAESDRSKLVRQISEVEPPRPRSLDRALPRDLETIVLKAIAKQPGDRYQTASSLASDLRHFLDDKPIQARAMGHTERVWRSIRRNPVISGLTAAVVLLAAVVGVAAWVTHTVGKERDRAIDAQWEARQSQQRAQQAEREVKIRSHLAQATAHRRSGRIGQRFQCLEELASAVKLDPSENLRKELRDEAIAALCLSDLRVRLDHASEVMLGTQCDVQLQRYAFPDVYQGGGVVVRQLQDDRELFRADPPGFSFWHASTDFTPNGQYLLICYFPRNSRPYDAVLHVWDLDRRELVAAHEIRSADIIGAVAVHGNQLFFVNRQSELCTWDLVARQEVRRLPLGMTPYSICVASDGRRVAVNEMSTPLVRILDLETGNELASWTREVGTYAMAWSADGQLLASAHSFNRIFVRHVPSGELLCALEGEVIRMAFAHRGYLLAASGWNGTTQLFDAAEGTKLVEAVGEMVRFSEDDRQLGYLRSGGVGIWELAHGIESRTMQPASLTNPVRTGFATGASFSPDGRLLAVSDTAGVQLWNRFTGEEIGYLPCGSSGEVMFHSDGQGLLTNSKGMGLHHWPIRRELVDGSELLTIGPPTLLKELDSDEFIAAAWLPNKRDIAIADSGNRRIFVVPSERAVRTSDSVSFASEHNRITSIAVSPDGRWLAAGGWKERGIQLWKLSDRQLERVLPHSDSRVATIFSVYFSPDGQWLVSAARSDDTCGYFAYRVGTWDRAMSRSVEFGTRVGVAFSADSRLMAMSISPTQVLIVDASDGRELLRLTNSSLGAWPAAFSGDGRELIIGSVHHPTTCWDLQRLEDSLQKLGLESGLSHARSNELKTTSPLPKQVRGNESGVPPATALQNKPFKVQLDLGDLPQRIASNERVARKHLSIAAAYQQVQSWASVRATMEHVLEISRDNATAHNALGWLLATCPDPTYRDSNRAVAYAIRAVELRPDNADYRNTLGVAQYRVGNYRTAISELTRAEELAPDRSFAHNGYFLAMAHAQLGERATALDWYRKSLAWHNEHRSTSFGDEMNRFRAEAEELLGIVTASND